MSNKPTYYVVCPKEGYPIKYIAPGDGYRVQLFALYAFSGAKEASEQFKTWLGPSHTYCRLDQEAFTAKVVMYTRQREEQAAKDRERKAKWVAMTGGKG